MKYCKKALSIVLAVMMVFSVIPIAGITAFAATSGDFEYRVISEEEKTCEISDYVGSATEVTIPSEIDGYMVTSLGYDTFRYCHSLKSIFISDSVTSIADAAFLYCTSLTSINVSKDNPKFSSENGILFSKDKTALIRYPAGKADKSYTIPDSVCETGQLAFALCAALTNIEFPANLTSIDISTFKCCGSLTNINVSDDNPRYSSANGVLFNKDKTELVRYPDGKVDESYTIPNSVTSIADAAFAYCASLKSITIPDSVTSIAGGVFAYCASLKSITIPDSVTSIGYAAFAYCKSLANITIPNSVSSIADFTFGFCASLTCITIPDSVTSIGYGAFAYCEALANITIPNSVKNIEGTTFMDCLSLVSITIPESVIKIGEDAFTAIPSLSSINVSENNVNYSSENGILFNKDKTELLLYPAGKSNTTYTIPGSVTSIANSAFEYCASLTDIIIPDSVSSIGDYAFSACLALISIHVSDNNLNYSSENGVLFNKEKTKLLLYPAGKTDAIYTVPDSVTYIDSRAFSDCLSLACINVSENNLAYSSENGVLFNKDKTELLRYPDKKADESYTIPNRVISISQTAFAFCQSLTSITIPESVTGIYTAFSSCISLTNINVSENNLAYSSENGVLFNKDKTELLRYPAEKADTIYTIPNSVSYIAPNSFSYCKFITEITIPDSVDAIDSFAFTNCSSLSKIVIPVSCINILTYALGYSVDYDNFSIKRVPDFTIYGYAGSMAEYYAKTNGFIFRELSALTYTTTYDTKQYYSAGGFYSTISSISDCVELYCLFENKISAEYAKPISPITLTATVSGNGLSFDRNSNQNTYTTQLNSIEPGKSIDDLLMLFPYDLTVLPEGNTYTVTVTLESDSFDTITEKYTFTVENLANKSANEHIGFTSSNPDYLKSKNNIYGQSMVTLKNDAEYKWSKYSSLDFENYYEVVFADVLVGLMDTAQIGHVSLLPVVKEWVGNYKTILSSVSTIVEDSYTGYLDVSANAIDKLLKKSKYITDGIHIDDELYQTVVDLLGNTGNAEKITKAFAAIDKTKQYYSFFKLGINITNDIVDFVNGASVLNSYKDMDDEFKDVVNNLYNQIPSSEKKLKDAVYHYVNVDSYLGYSEELFNAVRDMAGDITLDVFKSIYKKQVVSSLCKVIGNITLKSGVKLSATAAFSGVSTALGAFTTGWTLGTCVSDILCNNSGKSAEMSKVIAMSEFSPYVISTLNHYESKLYSDRNDTAVAEFEYAFAMHKATQSYIMARTVRALEIKRDSLIIKLFGRDDYDGVISDILAQKQSIDNLKCHTDGNTQTVVTKTKVIAVKCPVDVFIYDANGNEVVGIVNNVKELVADGISVAVESNEKYIALPMNQEYSVKIVATDAGTMEYFVTEYDDGVQRVQTVKKDNIALSPTRTFTGQIPKENDAAPKDYALHYDGKDVIPNDVITTPITGIKLNQNELKMHNGDKFKLTAVISPEDVTNKKVHWYSDNPEVATVDENGNVTAISTGTTTIRAVTDDWGYIDECTVKVVSKQALGDVNNDGIVDAADAVMIQRYDAGLTNLTSEQISLGDVNGDGIVDAADAVKIQRYDAGLIDKI